MNPDARSPVRGPGATIRKGVSLSQEDLVRESSLNSASLPLVFQPTVEGVSLTQWATGNVDLIKKKLLTNGAVLCRGFKKPTIADLEEFLTIVAGDLLDYSYRSTPRSQVSGKIYTSTEYPAHQTIPLHNEMSYSRNWPLKIWFFSIKTAEQGGETPIADSRRVFERIDPMIREKFSRKQIMYVRNY